MTFLAKKHLSRRTLLRGAGAAIALPFLDSMAPAPRHVRWSVRRDISPTMTRMYCARSGTRSVMPISFSTAIA